MGKGQIAVDEGAEVLFAVEASAAGFLLEEWNEFVGKVDFDGDAHALSIAGIAAAVALLDTQDEDGLIVKLGGIADVLQDVREDAVDDGADVVV